MTTVMIAVDASDSSVQAVRTAHRLFGDEADYLLLNVGAGSYVPVTFVPSEVGLISPITWALHPHHPVGDSDEVPDDDVPTDEQVSEMIARQIGQEGGLPDATALGVVGDAASKIIDVAVEHTADVIVVGTHERGWLTRLLTASVADEVRRASPIPVLVLPHRGESEHHR